LPQDIPLAHPACLISTWFGAGLLPIAPGTWGSLAALPFAWAIQFYAGPWALLGAAAVVFAVGVWSAGWFVKRCDDFDPGPVVVDEVAGQWLVLAFAPPEIGYYIAGFILFRAFDIRKPWPAGWIDRNMHGGIGIMLDDIAAAVYGALLLYALVLLTGGINVFA
jgi:phosphatidylglycerophosphatase A